MDTRRRHARPDEPAGSETISRTLDAEVEIVELGSVAQPGPGTGSRGVIAVGLAALFALAILTMLPGGEPAESPSPSNGAAATPTTQPVVFGTSQPAPFPWAWTEFELRGYGRGSSVANLWALGGLFVAEIETDEGPDGGPFGPVSSVLLASEDGTTWSDARVDLPFPGFLIDAGTVADGRLWVLGRLDASAELRKLWSTADGTWRLEPDPTGAQLNRGRVMKLAHAPCVGGESCDGAGWVAILGVPGSHDSEELWVSTDGVRWERADLPIQTLASLTGLTRRGPAWHVLAVYDSVSASEPVTEVLTTRDLVSWDQTRIATVDGRGRDITDGVAGLVVVGSGAGAAESGPHVWLAGMGVSWLGFAIDMLPGRPPAPIDLVTSTDQGYLAMSRTTGDAWLSTDGSAWRNLPAFDAESGDTVQALAASGDVLLAAGRSANGRPTFWRALLSDQLSAP